MSFEDEYAGRNKSKSPLTAFLPLMGLFLIVSLGAIAFIASEPVHELIYEQFFVDQELREGTPASESFMRDEIQYAVAGGLFVILVLLSGALYAAFAPKPDKVVTERELKQEKAKKEQELREQKRRKQMINKKVAAERERREKEAARRKGG